MSKTTYLTKKNGIYYFRISVPKEIRGKIHKKELIYSLKTRCAYESRIRLFAVLRATQALFKKFEEMPRLRPEEAQRIVKSYFRDCLECLEKQMDTVEDFSSAVAELPKRNKNLDIALDRKRLDFLYPDSFYDDESEAVLGLENNPEPDFERIISLIANQNQIDIIHGTPSYGLLENAARRAVKELLNVHKQYVNYEPDIVVEDSLFQIQNYSNLSNNIVSDDTPPVSEATHKYLSECKRNGESDHSINSKRATYELWIEIFKDHQVGQINKRKATEFKDALLKLPKNRHKIYPNKTISELLILKVSKDKLMSTATINTYIGEMSHFAKWLDNNGYLIAEKNPFEGLRLKKNKKISARDKRDPFSEKQIQDIFDTPVFLGCESETQHGRYQAGQTIIKDAYYWIPFIAIFTGSRMAEIIQMTVNDVKLESDIWCFDINDSDNKSLKTTQSKRIVPIHSKLIELGFLEYIESCKHSRIFNEIKPYNGDYSHRYSKWFSRYLERFNIKSDKTSFHSFRHNFRDSLKGKISETYLRALMGHEKGDVHNAYGSKSYDVKDLKNAIEHLKYDFIDFSKIK